MLVFLARYLRPLTGNVSLWNSIYTQPTGQQLRLATKKRELKPAEKVDILGRDMTLDDPSVGETSW